MFQRSFLAVSALLAAGPALAGGFEPAVVTPAPAAPVIVAPAPMAAPAGGDWSGFYAGGSLSYGDVSSGDVTPDDLLDGTGRLNGLSIGYNYDFGRIVVGGELEHEWSDVSLDNADIDLDRVARAKLRVGYDAGRFLPYVTAGVAEAYVSNTVTDDDENFDGRFVGIGAEYQLNDRFSTGVEVLRHEFNDVAPGVDLDVNTVSLRGIVHF